MTSLNKPLFGKGIDDIAPNMQNDDYKADLDSTNIAYYMRTNRLNLWDATIRYYDELNTGAITRASVFLEHTPIDVVVANVADFDTNEVAKKFVISLESDSNDFLG